MSVYQWLVALSLYGFQHWQDRRRHRRIEEQPQATLAQTMALSWLASMYARYGTDDHLAAVYTKWHFGVWPRQLPSDLRPRDSR